MNIGGSFAWKVNIPNEILSTENTFVADLKVPNIGNRDVYSLDVHGIPSMAFFVNRSVIIEGTSSPIFYTPSTLAAPSILSNTRPTGYPSKSIAQVSYNSAEIYSLAAKSESRYEVNHSPTLTPLPVSSTTISTPSASTTSGTASSSLSTGTKVGIGVAVTGVVLLLLFLGTTLCVIASSRRRQRLENPQSMMQYPQQYGWCSWATWYGNDLEPREMATEGDPKELETRRVAELPEQGTQSSEVVDAAMSDDSTDVSVS